jgi:hypothetical protein
VCNTWVEGLVEKHAANGLLLDSDLLLVYFVGVLDEAQISKAKGTREYTLADFRLLLQIGNRFDHIVTTPNVITEVSNLVGRLDARFRHTAYQLMRDRFVQVFEETYVSSEDAMKDKAFEKLGLTDASISVMASRGILVMTNDLDLSILLASLEIDCIHYDRDLRPIVLAGA